MTTLGTRGSGGFLELQALSGLESRGWKLLSSVVTRAERHVPDGNEMSEET